MTGIQVTIPLQMVCRLMIATQVGKNVTLPLNWNPTLVRNETLPVNREPKLVDVTGSSLLPSGYVAFPEFGFAYKLTETRLSHDNARKMCLKDNGQLAVIDSREKVDKVPNHFNYDQRFWVGLHLLEDAEEWTTIDGKSANNLPWQSGYPSENGRCGSVWKFDNGLNNNKCKVNISYLCEIALPRH